MTATLVRRSVAGCPTDHPLSLRAVLKQLSINPFDPETVAAYKERMLRKNTPWCTMLLTVTLRLALLAGCFGGISLFGGLIGAVVSWLSDASVIPPLITTVIGLSLTVLNVVYLPYLDSSHIVVPWWTRIHYDDYRGPIPDFALETMHNIHELCPDAPFFVEELRLRERVLDPFLIVQDPDNGTRYYLEVWLEPSFPRQW